MGVNGVCVSPDGRYAYVTHILGRYQLPTTQLERGWMNTNALSVIDVATQKLVNTVLIDDPQNRADYIEVTGNWWYVDDLACYYMDSAGKSDLFRDYCGSRICAPDPNGSGRDVLEWLRGTAL